MEVFEEQLKSFLAIFWWGPEVKSRQEISSDTLGENKVLLWTTDNYWELVYYLECMNQKWLEQKYVGDKSYALSKLVVQNNYPLFFLKEKGNSLEILLK